LSAAVEVVVGLALVEVEPVEFLPEFFLLLLEPLTM
jgi:hypothetical protein